MININNEQKVFPQKLSEKEIEIQLSELVTQGLNDQIIRNCELNLHNQRVIKADSERTRISDIKKL